MEVLLRFKGKPTRLQAGDRIVFLRDWKKCIQVLRLDENGHQALTWDEDNKFLLPNDTLSFLDFETICTLMASVCQLRAIADCNLEDIKRGTFAFKLAKA